MILIMLMVPMILFDVNHSLETANYQGIDSTITASMLSKSNNMTSSTHKTLSQEEQIKDSHLSNYGGVNKRTINKDDGSFESEPETATTISEKSNKNNETLHAGNLPEFTNPDKLSSGMQRFLTKEALFECAARGDPEPNITWTKDEQLIEPIVSPNTKWDIQIINLNKSDSGRYTCHVCNIHGCIEHTTRLDVTEEEERMTQNVTALVNSTVKLNCTIKHYYNDTKIGWTKVWFNPETQSKMLQTFRKERYLLLENITLADEGLYMCASDTGTEIFNINLKVEDGLPKKTEVTENRMPIYNPNYIIIAIMSILFVIIILIIYIKKLKHEKLEKRHTMETTYQWTKKVIIVKPSEDECDGMEALQIPMIRIEKQRTTIIKSANDPSIFNEYDYPLDSNWEFPRSQLRLGPTLGEGCFGSVVMAEAHGLNENINYPIVAVKMVKKEHTDSDVATLVREMEVMKMIGKHINIINLLRCCSQDGPLYVIVEYAPHGNLKDFLKKNLEMAEYDSLNTQHVLTLKDLASFAFQVACGMEYLASRKCIHRDLAARNILVCNDNIVKIADFGLARDIQDADYYRKCTESRLPIKWMAPESIMDRFYNSQSDVWSYGILVWEIMTFGENPYPQINSCGRLYDFLKEGKRMEKPERCSIDIYVIIRLCWNWNPNSRPTFTQICKFFGKIVSSTNRDELPVTNEAYISGDQ